MEDILVCPECHKQINEKSYFCPNCGANLKETHLDTSITKQITIYLISVLIPPSGLWWGFRYLRQDNDKSRKIGLIAIILTLVSLVLTIWLTINSLNAYTQLINQEINI